MFKLYIKVEARFYYKTTILVFDNPSMMESHISLVCGSCNMLKDLAFVNVSWKRHKNEGVEYLEIYFEDFCSKDFKELIVEEKGD